MQLFVDQDYLSSAFEEYGISKGSTAFPDLCPFLEQTLSEEPISAEAHAKFRKISWTFVMAGSNQAGYLDPDSNVVDWTVLSEARHKKALRAVLRFILLHMKMSRNFPHLDLRTFLKRTSVWKCIVMLGLLLCKLLRGEALLVA